MGQRLTDQYPVGTAVEIQFAGDPAARWWVGLVVAHASPGVWVALAGGRRFFVTNTRRIQAAGERDG